MSLQTQDSRPSPPMPFAAGLVLFAVSGCVALIYEVLWMKALQLLLGNTAQAAGAVLAAFFLGLAGGSRFWGARFARPVPALRAYGWLEIAAALAGTGYFLLPTVFRKLYPVIFDGLADSPEALSAAKFALALLALFPASFLLGGTLPAMAQWSAAYAGGGRAKVPSLYAVNTLGAAQGAVLAGLVLPPRLGYRDTYLAGMAAGLAIGFAALWLARRELPAETPVCAAGNPGIPRHLLALAAFSGFAALALQVLWTRMFAQTLQNSVQTFALIVAVFLLFLAAGAALAGTWARRGGTPERGLFWAAMAAAAAVGAVPFAFVHWTDGLGYIGNNLNFGDYLTQVSLAAAAVLGPAVLALGTVFPLILGLGRSRGLNTAELVGQLAAANTLGSVAGALCGGFFLFESLGLWNGIRLMAVLYFLVALECARRLGDSAWRRVLPMAGLVAAVTILDPGRLPLVRVDAINEDESLLFLREDSAATVAVVRRAAERQIKVDNYYTLGGTGSAPEEALQGSLPVLLHPEPESVFALGLGTGITAGAVLRHPVRRLVAAELLPGVIEAARDFFSAESFGLFGDPRVSVAAEDGRNYIAATAERFDVIVADLFVPWQAGAGSLYAKENFQAIRDHLRPGGLFMQWLPAYQLSEAEFGIIAHTLLEVFPEVSLWRGSFSPRTPVIGLLARRDPGPLSADALLFQPSQAEFGGRRLLSHYIGRLDLARYSRYGENTDDRPLIEFGAPVTQRRSKSAEGTWLNGRRLQALTNSVMADETESMAFLPAADRPLPKAGACLYQSLVAREEGYLQEAETAMACYRREIAAAGLQGAEP